MSVRPNTPTSSLLNQDVLWLRFFTRYGLELPTVANIEDRRFARTQRNDPFQYPNHFIDPCTAEAAECHGCQHVIRSPFQHPLIDVHYRSVTDHRVPIQQRGAFIVCAQQPCRNRNSAPSLPQAQIPYQFFPNRACNLQPHIVPVHNDDPDLHYSNGNWIRCDWRRCPFRVSSAVDEANLPDLPHLLRHDYRVPIPEQDDPPPEYTVPASLQTLPGQLGNALPDPENDIPADHSAVSGSQEDSNEETGEESSEDEEATDVSERRTHSGPSRTPSVTIPRAPPVPGYTPGMSATATTTVRPSTTAQTPGAGPSGSTGRQFLTRDEAATLLEEAASRAIERYERRQGKRPAAPGGGGDNSPSDSERGRRPHHRDDRRRPPRAPSPSPSDPGSTGSDDSLQAPARVNTTQAKVRKPDVFSGDRREYRIWKARVIAYCRGLDRDTDKIHIAISYISGPNVNHWVDFMFRSYYSNRRMIWRLEDGRRMSFRHFLKKLDEQFADKNEALAAFQKLQSLVQRDRDVKEFLLEFERLVALTDYDIGDNVIVSMLQVNANRRLVERIYNSGNIPQGYAEWKQRLITLNDADLLFRAHVNAYNPRSGHHDPRPSQTSQRPAEQSTSRPAYQAVRDGTGTLFTGRGQPMQIDRRCVKCRARQSEKGTCGSPWHLPNRPGEPRVNPNTTRNNPQHTREMTIEEHAARLEEAQEEADAHERLQQERTRRIEEIRRLAATDSTLLSEALESFPDDPQ